MQRILEAAHVQDELMIPMPITVLGRDMAKAAILSGNRRSVVAGSRSPGV